MIICVFAFASTRVATVAGYRRNIVGGDDDSARGGREASRRGLKDMIENEQYLFQDEELTEQEKRYIAYMKKIYALATSQIRAERAVAKAEKDAAATPRRPLPGWRRRHS